MDPTRFDQLARSLADWDGGPEPPVGWPERLRELRRVVPIAQTVTVGAVIVTLFSLDDYAEGFAVRLRLLLADDHPVAAEARAREADFRRRAEAVQRDPAALAKGVFRTGPTPPLPVPELELTVSDDQGQAYPQWGGGSQWSQWGATFELREEPHYAPPLDPSVRELRLSVPEVRWRSVRGREEGPVAAVDRGPWTFVVPV